MAYLDSDPTGSSTDEVLPPSSAQSRHHLADSALHASYSLPSSAAETPKASEIETPEQKVGVGSLVTIRHAENGADIKIYVSGGAKDIKALPSDVQAKLATEKVLVNPYNDDPSHKVPNLAQVLFGKKEGEEITLLKGQKAVIMSIIDLEN